MADQWIRKANLYVTTGTQPGATGLDLSQMQFRFSIKASDVETPNTAVIRVYNLSKATVNAIRGELSSVSLQAGYQSSNYGLIFQGTIKQLKHGKESDVDSYLDILAADGDIPYNSSVANVSIAAGSSIQQQFHIIANAFVQQGATIASDADAVIQSNAKALASALSPRGMAQWGMARDYMRDWADSYGFRWSLQNGQLTLVPYNGYRGSQGEAAQLNSQTGMIGMPEVTDAGITIRCLLNPTVRIGALVQINNADINQTWVKQVEGFPQRTSLASALRTAQDGFYRVMVTEHEGDTRGMEWYSTLTCLSLGDLINLPPS
jgi:hypothetical protein